MESIGWEKALIGTALADPDRMADAVDVVPSDLTGCHQIMWAEMMSLYQRGSLGPRALTEALRQQGALANLGFVDTSTGEAYIAEVMRWRGDEMPEYATNVIGASTKKQLGLVAALIRSEAGDDSIPAEEALDSAEKRVMSLRRQRSDEGDTAMALMTALSSRLDGDARPGWIPEQKEIAEVVQFAEEDDFIIVAARPGEGKSSLLRYELGMKAVRDNVPGLLINMENSQIEIARSLVTMFTGLDKTKLKTGQLTDEERQMVNDWINRISKSPLVVHSVPNPSAVQVDRICRQAVHKHGVKLIGVDYVQLMSNGIQNMVQDVSLSSKTLRGIALRHGVPVFAAAQMSRSIEHRGADAEPKLSDLRESGSLEQDATMVIFPRRVWAEPSGEQLAMFPENRNGTEIEENAIPVRFHVAKSRNSRIGITKEVLWVKATNRYRSLTNQRTWRS